MPLADLQAAQKQNLNAELLKLLDQQKQTERLRDLESRPKEQARLQVDIETILGEIQRCQEELAQLDAERPGFVSPPWRATLDENLSEPELNETFFQEVQTILELLKYDISREAIAGLETTAPPTFIGEQEGDFGLQRTLFQCTYGIVEENAAARFGTVYELNRTRSHLTAAVLVTNTYIAPAARRSAGDYRIQILTFAELLNLVFKISRYLQEKRREYEQKNELIRTYVEIKYLRRGTGEFSRNRVSRDETLVTEDPSRAWFEAKGDLTAYVDIWLRTPGGGQICLLGDYGTGKTSFATEYFYRRSKAYLEAPLRNRIPLLIPLNRYHKSTDIEQMITAFLVNECGVRHDFRTFMKMAACGKLLILLDGFDEMAKQVDVNVRRQNLREIGRLLVGENKVILSGRPNYFLNQEELEEILGQKTETDPYRAALQAVREPAPRYQVLKVALFDRWQIEEFLAKQSSYLREQGIDDWRELQKVIYSTYNLEELARTPVLLEIIIKTVSTLRSRVTEINAAKLYEIYTDFWLDREYQKGELRLLIHRQDKELFVRELAWTMLLTDHTRPEIHFSALSERVRKYFSLERAADIDYFASDIRFCSYLVHSPADGNYRFVHKSFMEYFCARHVYHAVVVEGKLTRIAIPKALPDEIEFFLSQMLGADGLEKLLALTRAEQDEAGRQFGVLLSEGLLREFIKVEHRRGAIQSEESWVQRFVEFCREYQLDKGWVWGLLALGEVRMRLGQFDEASELFGIARAESVRLSDPSSEGWAIVNLGDIAQRRGALDEALQHYRDGLHVLAPLGDTTLFGETLVKTGVAALSTRRLPQATENFQQGLAIFERLQDRANIGTTVRLMARVSLAQSDYPAALQHLQRALALFREIADRRAECEVVLEVAHVYASTGRFAEAEETSVSALAVARENGDVMGEGRALVSLGDFGLKLGKLEAAQQYYGEAVLVCERSSDLQGMATALSKLGVAYREMKRPQDALTALVRALDLSRQMADRYGTATTLLRVADVYGETGRFAEARQAAQEASGIFITYGESGFAGDITLRLGELALKQGEVLEAEQLFTNALEQKRQAADKIGEAAALEAMGRIAETRNDWPHAKNFYRQSLDIYEQVGARDRSCQMQLSIALLLRKSGETSEFIRLYAQYRERAVSIGLPTNPEFDKMYDQAKASSRVNPFVIGTPVRDRRGFAGRTAELRDVLNCVHEARPVLIVGERRIGKTSFLYEVMRRLADRFVPMYVNLQAFPEGLLETLQGMLHALWREFERHGLSGGLTREHLSISYSSEFIRAINSLMRMVPNGLRLVLIVDEVDIMAELGEDLPPIFDEMIAALSRFGASTVLAGTERLTNPESPNDFAQLMQVVELGPLSKQDMGSFMNACASEAGVRFTNEALDALYYWSGGSPFDVQLIGYEALKLTDSPRIDKGIIDQAADRIVREQPMLQQHRLQSLTQPEQDILLEIATGSEPDISSENPHLRSLERKNRVRKQDGKYIIIPRLFEAFLRA